MQGKEPGSGEERQRDKGEPRVAAAVGVAGGVGEDRRRQSSADHQPEVGGIVLPADVEIRRGEQKREPGSR
jgi:hypothetical protein